MEWNIILRLKNLHLKYLLQICGVELKSSKMLAFNIMWNRARE